MDTKFWIILTVFLLLIALIVTLIVRSTSDKRPNSTNVGNNNEKVSANNPESYISVKQVNDQKKVSFDSEGIKKTNNLLASKGKKFNFAINDGSHIDIILLNDNTVYVIKEEQYIAEESNLELLKNAVAKEQKVPIDNKLIEPVDSDEETNLFDEVEAPAVKKYDLDDPGIDIDTEDNFFEEDK